MIAVTCSACHLRFEASAVERRLHGPTITCPACDAGEPIVMDFGKGERDAGRIAERAKARVDAKAGVDAKAKEPMVRRKVTPPPLDLSRGLMHVRPQPDAAPESADDVPLPVYVDFDEPAHDPAAPPVRATGFGLAFTGLALAAVALAGPALSLAERTPLKQEAQRIVANWMPFAAPAAGDRPAGEEITTAAISPVQSIAPPPAIVRVATELAETDDGRVLNVRTDLKNEADGSIAAPALRISIRGADGTVLHRWTQAFEGTIEPGETRAFNATTTRIPEGAGDVKVDFARR